MKLHIDSIIVEINKREWFSLLLEAPKMLKENMMLQASETARQERNAVFAEALTSLKLNRASLASAVSKWFQPLLGKRGVETAETANALEYSQYIQDVVWHLSLLECLLANEGGG